MVGDLILLQLLICVCSFEVCWASYCDLFQDPECKQKYIKNGNVCHKWDGYARQYNLVVRCDKNFHLWSYSNQTCLLFNPRKLLTDFDSRYTCILDKTSTNTTTTTTMSKSVPETSASDVSKCKTFDDSAVKKHCVELVIENGDVCYVWKTHIRQKGGKRWNAIFTCKDGFHLIDPSLVTCEQTNGSWGWNNSAQEYICEPDKTSTRATTATTEAMSTSVPLTSDDGGNKAVLITIPTVVILAIVLLVIPVLVYRRRKRSSHACPVNHQQQQPTPCEEHIDYDDIPEEYQADIANNVDTERGFIPEVLATGDNEYDTLHTNVCKNKTKNGNPRSYGNDTYSHATYTATVHQEDESTYSHVTNDDSEHRHHRLNKDTDNVYNTLEAHVQNIGVNANDYDMTEACYDHTGTQCNQSSVVDDDTYAHVNSG